MIQKRTRNELYNKFRQGAIPSGADFADFIRSELNLLDDGIDTSDDPKEPICLKSHGDEENILDFADGEGRKRWRISGRNEEKTEEGLNIKADDNSKLYIERDTGNVGIGTDKPSAKLHILQTGNDDVIRIDDENNDTTPFVITSEGQVGIGTGNGDERPQAKVHISHDGPGDAFRVDDATNDTTPLIINQDGNVGIGCTEPKAKLTVLGGVSIGDSTKEPGSNNLYIKGDLEVGGAVKVSGGIGGIEISAPLTASTETLTLLDNVEIKAGTPNTPPKKSEGNLSVEGTTTLGTYNAGKKVIINGSIESGGIPKSSTEQQYDLEINQSLVVNRQNLSVNVKGDFTAVGDSTLGANDGNTIKLNGAIQRDGDQDVTINDKLTVTQKATIEAAQIKILELNNAGVTVNEIANGISNAADVSDIIKAALPTEYAVKKYVDDLLAGTVVAFARNTAPEGWLECNGWTYSGDTYPRLFERISTKFGSGDGSPKSFNVPNLKNQFVRGWDRDSTRVFGDNEYSAFQDHTHNFSGTPSKVDDESHDHWSGLGGYSWNHSYYHYYWYWWWWWEYRYYTASFYWGGRTGSSRHSHTFTPSGTISGAASGNPAAETRPDNVALLYCIKY
ncbi:MAG TPA: phage tail protein [Bacillota bacterium]|nr:phage tail protein [Bacillota bacterium]